jgi:arsenite methyltransferase
VSGSDRPQKRLHPKEKFASMPPKPPRIIPARASALDALQPGQGSGKLAVNTRALGSSPGAAASSSKVTDSVAEYYGKVLSTQKDLKTSACTASSRPSARLRALIDKVPSEITDKFYGCGTPLPSGGIEGLTVLDLGSGSGRDCYVSSQLVGPGGRVIGVDMTDEQLSVAREHADSFCARLGYPATNMRFVKGYIERLREAGVPDASVDLIISNCVINLSPDKPAVVRGMFDALKFGGEAMFSDVYCDRRLPADVRSHEVLWGECISGALYVQDFERLCRAAGFLDPRVVDRAPVTIQDPDLADVVGEARFESITYRLFKLPEGRLETLCEDYGQVATYLGTIPGAPGAYVLDAGHTFVKNKPHLVCGNSAAMLAETWLGKHFAVSGDRSTHYGLFDCAHPAAVVAGAAGGSCC